MSNFPRSDAGVVVGITTLFNTSHIDHNVNLEDAEKKVMGRNISNNTNNTLPKKNIDQTQIYTDELNKIANEIGIDLFDESTNFNSNLKTPKINNNNSSYDEDEIEEEEEEEDEDEDEDEESSASSTNTSRSKHSTHSNQSKHSTHSKQSKRGNYIAQGDYASQNKSNSKLNNKLNNDDNDNGRVDRIMDNRPRQPVSSYNRVKKLPTDTLEQEKRRHINSVVDGIRGETKTSFGVERERIQDLKASKLEQAEQLRASLEDEGIDCSNIGKINSDSAIEEVDSVLNILRLKNDRTRYSSLADEIILGFAEGVETVFDGSREVPLLGWRPDYTGYHNTVNVKLHRMRFETSQVVGDIIEKYNVGPTARIVMELLPSFFLYPRQQSKQKQMSNLSNDFNVGDSHMAMETIRSSNEKKTLNTLQNI